MNEPPVRAVRGKRDSSLMKGLLALKEGEADAFVSPGNTGAVVAGSIFTLGRITGILRPAIAVSIPTVTGKDILALDMGANVDCAPEHLVHFALMGATYAREVLGIDHPTIGLLNIGTEKAKGNRLNQRAFELLEGGPLPFMGNVEGHHLLTERPVDVVVCDGFVGNIFLKALEGGISAVTGLLKDMIGGSIRTKFGGLLLRPVFLRCASASLTTASGGAAPRSQWKCGDRARPLGRRGDRIGDRCRLSCGCEQLKREDCRWDEGMANRWELRSSVRGVTSPRNA